MNGKQLKNSILQWAIQGHLVPQDPNDEPASVLLERIQAEKQQLVADGKLKPKDLTVSTITRTDDNHYIETITTGTGKKAASVTADITEQIPFDIPASWQWSRIKNIFSTTSGGTPIKGHPEYYVNGNIPWVKSGELRSKYIDKAETLITEEALKHSSAKYFPVDTVAVAMYGATIGKTSIFKAALTTNQAICGIFPNNNIYAEYLYYFIRSKVNDYLSIAFGSGQPNISQDKIKETLIPIPPLSEQQRIVKKLDEVMAKIDQYAAAQDKLDALNNTIKPLLRKSILQEAIQGHLVPQDPNDEPASVLLQRIQAEKQQLVADGKLKPKDLTVSTITRTNDNHYIETITTGTGKKASSVTADITEQIPFDIPASWQWVRGYFAFLPMQSTKPSSDYFCYIDIEAVNNKLNIIDKVKMLPKIKAPSRATRKLHRNDILFSMVRPYLRNIALITGEYENAIASTGFYVVTPTCAYYPQFLFYLLLSSYVIDGLNEFMKGDNSPSINNYDIEHFLFPLPPLAEQQRIVQQIQALFAKL